MAPTQQPEEPKLGHHPPTPMRLTPHRKSAVSYPGGPIKGLYVGYPLRGTLEAIRYEPQAHLLPFIPICTDEGARARLFTHPKAARTQLIKA